ncbi:MAG TPA: hypothetical protein VF547_06220 [Allosphingosinicella sp.]|jgi:hypothetical protein
MRHFKILAAVAVALMAGGVATAKEQPAKAKPKKICRVQEESATRIAARRVCRVVTEDQVVRAKSEQQDARQPQAGTQTD